MYAQGEEDITIIMYNSLRVGIEVASMDKNFLLRIWLFTHALENSQIYISEPPIEIFIRCDEVEE